MYAGDIDPAEYGNKAAKIHEKTATAGNFDEETIKDMEENSILVHIDSRDIISVDDEPLSDPTRLADIMRSKQMSEVLITAHENSLHDTLTKVIDASNEIGMQKIRVGIVKGND